MAQNKNNFNKLNNQSNQTNQNKNREEFGSETDPREVQQQNTKAEQNKQNASGQFAKANTKNTK